MKYLLFICSSGPTAPEDVAVLQAQTPAWVDEMNGRGVRLFGQGLQDPSTAATIRVRGGEALITDGPFVETKEHVAGFDLIECEDLDEAIEVAAKHPMSWFHAIEIRPLDGDRIDAAALAGAEARARYMFMIVDYEPWSDGDRATFEAGLPALIAEMKRRDAWVTGHRLQGPETATTVRVRDGETLLSDGPFADTKEFIAGFDVIDCPTREDAIELASVHPIAALRMLEVRPFWET